MIELAIDFDKETYNWLDIKETKCISPDVLTGVITGTAPAEPGVYEIPFTIKDKAGKISYQTVQLTVMSSN